jgi:hypothetical protein
MTAEETLQEVLRIKRELSAETQGMNAEELRRFFRDRRSPSAQNLLEKRKVESRSRSESQAASRLH